MEQEVSSIVDRVHDQIRQMAMTYELRPGERLNEVELSKKLGVSRTPLREALNRLNTEGFLKFVSGKGFYCRELDPKEIFDLYEVRKTLETSAVPLIVQRAKDEDIDALEAFLQKTGPEPGGRATEELVALDETFHERLITMAGNAEMVRILKNINARIQFVRWLDLDSGSRVATQREHRAVLKALRRRDAQAAVDILEKHINRRLDQITAVIRRGIAEIYMRSASNPKRVSIA